MLTLTPPALWGTHGYSGEVMIVIGGERAELETGFEHVELAAVHVCPAWIARRSRVPLDALWDRARAYQ